VDCVQRFDAYLRTAGRGAEADAARFMTTKILEPAYNFRGIVAEPARENVGWLTGLLGFYLVCTLWYGFGILYFFEGSASPCGRRDKAGVVAPAHRGLWRRWPAARSSLAPSPVAAASRQTASEAPPQTAKASLRMVNG